MFHDLVETFDTVDHSNLLRKLEHMIVEGHVLSVLKSYLDTGYHYFETNLLKIELKNLF